MLVIRPGWIVYSSRHNCLLKCTGRNGGRQNQYLGQVVRDGKPDPDTMKIFEAADVSAVMTGQGMRHILPGSLAATWNPPPMED